MRVAEANKLQSVQICRAAAALLVLLFHATGVSKAYLNCDLLWGFFQFGYSGVDLFFVLSGFVIYWVHRGDVGQSERIRIYLKKRFLRIYPIYWIVALILLPIYFGAPHDVSDYIVLLKSLLLFPQPGNPVVTVAWSLSHEVFFYAMFALAIYFSWRRIRALFLTWLVITAFVYLGKLLTLGTLQLPPHTGFLFSPYSLEFAMGCAIGYLIDRYHPVFDRAIAMLGVTIFLVCGLNEGLLHVRFGRHHSILIYGFSSMLIVWGAVLWEQRSRIVMPSLLMLLGDASYSIYLTHFALLDLLVRGSLALNLHTLIEPTMVAVITIALSLGLGVLFYLYVERPVLARLRKRTFKSANQWVAERTETLERR